jgi:hypothetical protein
MVLESNGYGVCVRMAMAIMPIAMHSLRQRVTVMVLENNGHGVRE